MHTFAMAILEPWSNFYVMTGSAAAGLTGLMFVVITLVTGERARRSPDGIKTFSTPTVAHFGVALLVSAIALAPWRRLLYPEIIFALCGVCGLAYIVHLMRRARRLSEYTPDAEDWTWYTALPLLAYAAILASAILLIKRPGDGLFADAAGVMLLIFIGIHNAWDIVTYLATGAGEDPDA
jgi:hypothetical protein